MPRAVQIRADRAGEREQAPARSTVQLSLRHGLAIARREAPQSVDTRLGTSSYRLDRRIRAPALGRAWPRSAFPRGCRLRPASTGRWVARELGTQSARSCAASPAIQSPPSSARIRARTSREIGGPLRPREVVPARPQRQGPAAPSFRLFVRPAPTYATRRHGLRHSRGCGRAVVAPPILVRLARARWLQ